MRTLDFVRNVSICMLCSRQEFNCKNRYNVIDKKGSDGAMFGLVSQFLDCTISKHCSLFGLYTCRECRNLLLKWRKHKDLVEQIELKLKEGNQFAYSTNITSKHGPETPKKTPLKSVENVSGSHTIHKKDRNCLVSLVI